jgi:hypothetical protein
MIKQMIISMRENVVKELSSLNMFKINATEKIASKL